MNLRLREKESIANTFAKFYGKLHSIGNPNDIEKDEENGGLMNQDESEEDEKPFEQMKGN